MLGALTATAVGGLAWRAYAPRSFWYSVAFPIRCVHVYLTWGHVASGVGVSRKRRRLRWSLEPVPLAGAVAEVVRYRRRVRRVDVNRAPRLGLVRPTAFGWRVGLRLSDGQNPDDYVRVADRFAHAWRVHAVRVSSPKPGRVVLTATVRDPLFRVGDLPEPGDLLRVPVGRLETGEAWVLDFRTVPHWLNAGATQSGKSNLANAIIRGLAAQPVALVGFDLKGGVEFTPYRPRLSALATTRAECVALLDDVVRVLASRMQLCRVNGARNIWRLPEHARPVPVAVLVDEVAELFLMADKSEKEEIAKTATALLRVAQLGRAFGVYLFVCGQRIGSDLGPGVTALRAQLSGRVCHRVNDPETANMTLGDMDPAALQAARQIPAETPGVAIVAGQDGQWHRARSVLVGEDDAEHAARAHAHRTPAWAEITATGPVGLDPTAAADYADPASEPPAEAA
ncbi:MAG: cell division protein FtsK [Streptosporangiales bacterium]|nr:cell division protein FtsK [Streptosporangiales bacterium]